MTVQMNVGERYVEQEVNRQICARGWQDYMMETQFFLGEARVDDCLKQFATAQLVKLGLSTGDLRKLRNSASVVEVEQEKIAA